MSADRGPSILVLCTGNSARSQIAAAYLEEYAGDRFDVYSAGSEPAEQIHPLAREVMREQGFELSGDPEHLRTYLGHLAPYYLITVCDGAARSCPSVWPGARKRLHWPFEDPAAFEGTDDQRLAKFRQVRDQIEAHVLDWLKTTAERNPAEGLAPSWQT